MAIRQYRWRWSGALMLALVASDCAAQAAERDVQVEDTVMEYYPVEGSSASELTRAMKTYGPAWTDGQRHFSTCHWYLRWKARYMTSGGRCGIDTLQLNLSATITFPKWSRPEAGSASLRDKWEQMTKALRRHEDGHKDNGVRAANDLARRLRTLAPSPDCPTLEREINANLDRVIKEYREVDQAYDRSTNHGINQGATLN